MPLSSKGSRIHSHLSCNSVVASVVSGYPKPLLTFGARRLLFNGLKMEEVKKTLRVLVSRDKKRFTKEGFDLDLTYITDKIIGRNPMSAIVPCFFSS